MKFFKIGNLLKLLLFIVVLSSCKSIIDVSEDEQLRGGYKKNDILKAQRDIRIDKEGWACTGNVNAQVFVNGKSVGDDKKGILKQGDKIQIERIILSHHPTIGDIIIPVAIVLNGQLKGEEITLQYISNELKTIQRNGNLLRVPTINPEYLKKIDNGT